MEVAYFKRKEESEKVIIQKYQKIFYTNGGQNCKFGRIRTEN